MHYPTSGEEHRVLRVLWRTKNDPKTLLSSPATPFLRRTTPLHNMAAGAVLHLPSRGPAGPQHLCPTSSSFSPSRAGVQSKAEAAALWGPAPPPQAGCAVSRLAAAAVGQGREARPRWWPRLRPVVFARSGRHQSWSRNTQDALNSKTCFPFRGC